MGAIAVLRWTAGVRMVVEAQRSVREILLSCFFCLFFFEEAPVEPDWTRRRWMKGDFFHLHSRPGELSRSETTPFLLFL